MAIVELLRFFSRADSTASNTDGVLLLQTTLPFVILTPVPLSSNKYKTSTNYSRVGFSNDELRRSVSGFGQSSPCDA